MGVKNKRDLDQWIQVLHERRPRLVRRLALALTVAIPLGIAIHRPALAALWFAAYAALQLLEAGVFTHARIDRLPASQGLRVAALSLNVSQGAMFGLLNLLVLLLGPPKSPGVATTLVVALLIISITASRGSRTAFMASLSPHAVFLTFVLPGVLAFNEGLGDRALSALIGGLIGSAATIMAWRAYTRLLWSEADARAEADQRRAEAESATAAKSAFVAMVSHELRTPISAIQAGATALEGANLAPAHRDQAGLIVEAGRMMRTLLDDLLDLSKLDAGQMSVERIAFDARLLVRNTHMFWRAEARKKGLALRLDGTHRLPQWLEGDPTRLRQILNNLLSNALKFTDRGAVTLKIRVEETLELSVIDSGAGMSEEQMGRLFKPFGQADESITRTHGGTGLGLAISRDLARLMAGDIVVTSSPGAGSIFTLSTPLVRAAAPEAAPVAVGPIASLPRLRILAVDDHEINRRAMTLILEPLDVLLTVAASGPEALERMVIEQFDVVLLDVHMPVVGGPEVAELVRARPGPNQSVPILAVTGAADRADEARYRRAGMNGCVAKPIDAAELYAAIERVCAAQPGVSARAKTRSV